MASEHDWQTYGNLVIRKQAERLCALVTHDRAHKRVELLSILDFFLGALHELVRADLYGFQYKPNQQPHLQHIRDRTAEMSKGRWRRDGRWMAGLHFNSALVRLAAVHDRSLKLVVGGVDRGDRLEDIRRRALRFYFEHRRKQWS